jgi:hypothetical protein
MLELIHQERHGTKWPWSAPSSHPEALNKVTKILNFVHFVSGQTFDAGVPSFMKEKPYN